MNMGLSMYKKFMERYIKHSGISSRGGGGGGRVAGGNVWGNITFHFPHFHTVYILIMYLYSFVIKKHKIQQ